MWNNLNDPNHYHRDKAARKEHYEKYVKGWKQVPCTACNGSGYYDYTDRRGRTPKCSACDGTGKEQVSPAEYARRKQFPEVYGI
jgi:RecJ-like exonuclease